MPHNLAALCSLAAIPMIFVTSYLFYTSYRTGTNIEINVSIEPHNHKIKTQLRSSVGDGSSSNRDPLLSTSNDQPTGEAFVNFDDVIVPSCARDVVVTLHDEGEADGEGESLCKGLLIRDDIIVTSNGCSKSSFTFNFAGVGILEAVPHPTLNSDGRMADSRLGFLEANPPYHHYFIDQPVRRTRMFLSLRSGYDNGTSAIIRCEGHKPIAHNFLVEGEMVPLGQLMGVVPEDILWEHTDIYTSPELSHYLDRWWTRRISKKDEEDTFRQMLDQYRGPPGSVSIPSAHDEFVTRASALCEAVDPRGHRRDTCFKNYFARWQSQKPFSGTHFFDWLDFGDGKFLLERNQVAHFLPTVMEKDEKCNKEYFNGRRVHYFSDAERLFHEIYITPSDDGMELIARYKQNDEPVPESHMDDPHLYMWGLDKRFYIVDHRFNSDKYGTVKHTGLLGGQPALSAGKAYFGKNGAIWGINFSSGHYRPGIDAATMMYSWMKDEQGFNVTALHWVGRMSWSTADCRRTDWKSIQISGYDDAVALDLSCRELTVSPTWVLKDDV